MLCEVLTNNLFMVLSLNSYKLNLLTSGIRAKVGGLIGKVFIRGFSSMDPFMPLNPFLGV